MSLNSGKRFIKNSYWRLPLIFGIVALFAGVWFFSGGWFWKKPVLVESTEIFMDTTFNVKIFIKDKKSGQRLIKEAFDEARRIEHIMEPVKGDGELKRLNTRTGNGWFGLSPELRAVMKQTFVYYERSGGAFDPTIAPVKWLWGFEDGGQVPDNIELKEKLDLVNLSLIELKSDSLRFKDSGTRLDLGGVAKGFAVDRMLAIIKRGGAKAVLVNAGGDIATYGKKPGDRNWVIGLRHPRLNRTIIMDAIPFPSVATSGDYERYFMENGVRYHHILDPVTGYPARDCISVTAWTTSAVAADILATTIFVMGQEKGLALAENLDNVETLIFFKSGGKVNSVMSSGIKGRIRL